MSVHEAWIHVMTRTVVPGQPISVRWALRRTSDTYAFNADLKAGVIAQVLIDGLLAYTSPPTPVDPSAEQTIAPQEALLADFSPSLEKVVYKTGYHPVSLHLRGIANNYWLASQLQEVVRVRRETIDSSWWEWISPLHQELEWKTSYSMTGRLVNKSAWGLMSTAYLTLTDTGYDGASLSTLGPTGLMNLGTKVPLVSAPITKDWAWFVKGAHFPKGPRHKSFVYVVEFTFLDNYGNSYEAVASSEVSVRVSVSDKKLAAFAVAWGLTVTAAGFALAGAAAAATIIGGIAAAPLFATAAGFYAAALIAYVVANDPPEPDERFLERVEVSRLELQGGFEREASAIRLLVELIGRVLTADGVLTEIHGRLLGARLADNIEGVQLQTQAYEDVERLLIDGVAVLPETIERVIGELGPTLASERFQEAARVWVQEGLPENIRQEMIDGGISEAGIDDFDAVVSSREGGELIMSGSPLAVVLEGVERFSQTVRAETANILNLT